jgi:tetratricopeptide (TPR) repeat protein
LNWIGRAVSEVLTREISAIPSSAIYAVNEHFGRRPVSAPGVSTEFADALLAGADHVITGYYDLEKGVLRFHLVEEEGRTGKRLRDLTAEGSIFDATGALARAFTATPKPYPTRSEAALKNYILGLEGNGEETSSYEAAVAADPNFPYAYLAWGESALAHKDADTVARVTKEAEAHKIDPATLAKLQFTEATAFNDAAGRIQALQRMVELDSTNTSAIEALGEAEMTHHHFKEAAEVFAKGASEARPDLINQRAYALMFAGDEKGALEAIRQYQKARPQDPNTMDSEGDLRYYYGHFAEAEKAYLATAAKDPQFNQGAELWKAARAHLTTGDVSGATAVFERYRKEREKEKDITIPFRAAYWQFLTGDLAGAIHTMHEAVGSAPNAGLKSIELAQAAIWELQLGRNAEASSDADLAMKGGQVASAVPAAIVRLASMTRATPDELRSRIASMFNGPGSGQIRQLALGYDLFLAKRYAEAAPVWKEVYEETNPGDPAPRFLYAASLEKSGHVEEAAQLRKNYPPPQTGVAASFESLYFTPGSTAAPAK